jgi:hypothetical protein
MSRTTLLACMWITWAVVIVVFPFTFAMALGSGMSGEPWPGALLLGLLGMFACDGVAALLLTGVVLERDGKLLSIRVDWVAPIFWAVSLLNTGVIVWTVAASTAVDPTSSIPGLSWPLATLGLPVTIALSGSWITRRRQAQRSAMV